MIELVYEVPDKILDKIHQFIKIVGSSSFQLYDFDELIRNRLKFEEKIDQSESRNMFTTITTVNIVPILY